jgi:large subunit ribosomal protein L18
MVVNRSSRHVFVQIVDDAQGVTVAQASTLEHEFGAFTARKVDMSSRVGELVAERAKARGVQAAVFDRGGMKYHGRVAAVADGARGHGFDLRLPSERIVPSVRQRRLREPRVQTQREGARPNQPRGS